MMLGNLAEVDTGNRREWLDWRRGGIGGSDMPAVLGLSPYRTALDVYLEKIIGGDDGEPTEAQEIGHAAEPMIAALYQRRTGRTITLQQVAAECEAHPRLLATLDGITSCGRLVEFKTAGSVKASELGEPGTDQLPKDWVVQGHHQMLVADAPCVDFAVLKSGFGLTFSVYTLERDPEWDAVLAEESAEFWAHVLANDPPPAVLPDDLRNLARLFPLDGSELVADLSLSGAVSYWESLGDELKAIEAKRRKAEGEIRMAMEAATSIALLDGRKLKRYVQEVAERTNTVKAHTRDYLKVIKGTKS